VTVTNQTLTGRSYGLTFGLSLLGIPTDVLKPTPDTGRVSTTSDGTVGSTCLNISLVVTAHAVCGSVTTKSVPGSSVATAGLADATIGYSTLPVITLKTVKATSTTTCAGSAGTVTIAYLKIGSIVVIAQPTAIAPNTTLSVAGVSLVLNQQLRFSSPDSGLTVNAVVVHANLLIGSLTVIVSSAESDIGNCP
jgi:hypothetical protein